MFRCHRVFLPFRKIFGVPMTNGKDCGNFEFFFGGSGIADSRMGFEQALRQLVALFGLGDMTRIPCSVRQRPRQQV